MKPFDKVYRHYNTFMHNFKLFRVDQTLAFLNPGKDDTVADLGGGTGVYATAIARVCKKVHLFDESAKMLSIAEAQKPGNMIVHQCDITATPVADGCFDAILLSDVFHHVRDQRKLIDEIARIIKRDGTFVIMDFDARHLVTKCLGFFEQFLFGALHYKSRTSIEADLESAGFLKERELLEAPLFIQRWKKQ